MLRLLSRRELIVSWQTVEADANAEADVGKKCAYCWLAVETEAEADVGKKVDCWLACCRGCY